MLLDPSPSALQALVPGGCCGGGAGLGGGNVQNANWDKSGDTNRRTGSGVRW